MRKIILILGIMIAVAVVIGTLWNPNQQQVMDYRQLDGVDGMIFIFPQAELRTFWNKNTYLDLQIYWLRNHQIIGQSFLPSIERSKEYIYVRSPGPVDTVIEEAKK